jgi:hypothetical protein
MAQGKQQGGREHDMAEQQTGAPGENDDPYAPGKGEDEQGDAPGREGAVDPRREYTDPEFDEERKDEDEPEGQTEGDIP